MVKVVSFVKLVSGGYNVLVRGQLFGWARMADTAAEMAGIALILAF